MNNNTSVINKNSATYIDDLYNVMMSGNQIMIVDGKKEDENTKKDFKKITLVFD